MGKRFLAARYLLGRYSERRAQARLNEGDFEPHRMRPYGFGLGGFTYRQVFAKKHQSRQGNQRVDRAAKKTVRQQVRRELREYGE